jgi:hypothetical protein
MAQVAIRAEVVAILVEVHLCLSASSESVDFVWCYLDKEGRSLFDIQAPLAGVFQSQPSRCYARETPCSAASVLGRRLDFS